MVSVDCEMCSTAQGLELTRASLVDSKGQVIILLYFFYSFPFPILTKHPAHVLLLLRHLMLQQLCMLHLHHM